VLTEELAVVFSPTSDQIIWEVRCPRDYLHLSVMVTFNPIPVCCGIVRYIFGILPHLSVLASASFTVFSALNCNPSVTSYHISTVTASGRSINLQLDISSRLHLPLARDETTTVPAVAHRHDWPGPVVL
jgi:hypothetical protein